MEFQMDRSAAWASKTLGTLSPSSGSKRTVRNERNLCEKALRLPKCAPPHNEMPKLWSSIMLRMLLTPMPVLEISMLSGLSNSSSCNPRPFQLRQFGGPSTLEFFCTGHRDAKFPRNSCPSLLLQLVVDKRKHASPWCGFWNQNFTWVKLFEL